MIDISVSNIVKEFEVGRKILDGLTFQVDKSVLVPRADTERLCELVIEQARQKVLPRILDLCCG